jgi:large subunit ribosomal protein L28
MAQVCQITGKKPLKGHRVSHSNIKTKHTQGINLQKKRYFVHELGQWVAIRVSTSGIRNLTKVGGLGPYLLGTSLKDLDPALRRWKKAMAKRLKIACA